MNKLARRYVDEPETDWWLRSCESNKVVSQYDDEEHHEAQKTYHLNVGYVYGGYDFDTSRTTTRVMSNGWHGVDSGVVIGFEL